MSRDARRRELIEQLLAAWTSIDHQIAQQGSNAGQFVIDSIIKCADEATLEAMVEDVEEQRQLFEDATDKQPWDGPYGTQSEDLP
jgi:hypothetical protein